MRAPFVRTTVGLAAIALVAIDCGQGHETSVITAAELDQTCVTAAECERVSVGDACACALDTEIAINVRDEAKYESLLASRKTDCAPASAPCAEVLVLVTPETTACKEGRCVVTPLCAPRATCEASTGCPGTDEGGQCPWACSLSTAKCPRLIFTKTCASGACTASHVDREAATCVLEALRDGTPSNQDVVVETVQHDGSGLDVSTQSEEWTFSIVETRQAFVMDRVVPSDASLSPEVRRFAGRALKAPSVYQSCLDSGDASVYAKCLEDAFGDCP